MQILIFSYRPKCPLYTSLSSLTYMLGPHVISSLHLFLPPTSPSLSSVAAAHRHSPALSLRLRCPPPPCACLPPSSLLSARCHLRITLKRAAGVRREHSRRQLPGLAPGHHAEDHARHTIWDRSSECAPSPKAQRLRRRA